MSSHTSIQEHTHRQPPTAAYLIYDFSSPIFSPQEIATIFSSSAISEPLKFRIEHITSRSSSTQRTALCIGEYTSAAVAGGPSALHGLCQIFPGWETHPATKKFRDITADTPVVQPSGLGPGHTLTSYLDQFTGEKNPLEVTWVMKFLLVPTLSMDGKMDARWSKDLVERPETLQTEEWKQVLLVCVDPEGFQMENVQRMINALGQLFDLPVSIVLSLAG
jgi:hypothetical protein